MPGQGNRWKALHDEEEYIREQLAQDCEAGSLVGRWLCVGVVRDIARGEQVGCLRHGGERLRKHEEFRGHGAIRRFLI